MNEHLPDPMTPADCDLRGNDWMPMHGHKLYSSYFDAHASDEEWRAANKLWWVAWQQELPAASLPDDDVVLCRHAGFGKDVKTWKKIKGMALHGFVLCSDGRLYHRFLADEAVKAYALRIKSDRKREADRARLQAWRDARRAGTALKDDGNVAENADETHRETQPEAPSETHVKRVSSEVDKTRQDRTGQRKEEREAAAPSEIPAREPEPIRRWHMPKRSDPPNLWAQFADGWEVDGKMVKRPLVAGEYFDVLGDLVLTAAGIHDPHWRGDWTPVVRWLKSGVDGSDIIARIKHVASRPGYRPPTVLAYFDKPILEHRSAA